MRADPRQTPAETSRLGQGGQVARRPATSAMLIAGSILVTGVGWASDWRVEAERCLHGTQSREIDVQLCGLALRRASSEGAAPVSLSTLHLARARAYLGLGNTAATHTDLDQALVLNPTSATAWRLRSEAHRHANALGPALDAIARAHRLSRFDAPILRELGYTRLITADDPGALDALTQALDLNALDPQTWVLRGIGHYLEGRREPALDDFAQAARLAFAYDYLPVWQHLAEAKRAGRDRAHVGFGLTPRRSAQRHRTTNAAPYGSPYGSTGQTSERAASPDPRDREWPARLLEVLGTALANPDLSPTVLEQMLSRLEPERRPEVWFYLAEARLQVGDETTARRFFTQAACAPISTAERYLSQRRLHELVRGKSANAGDDRGTPRCT